jgi:hypothetical protein
LWLKFFLLAFPDKKESLMRNHPAELLEGEMAVLPRPLEAWKCLILTVLWPGTLFDLLPVIPFGEELRQAVRAIFSRSSEPSICKILSSLARQWDKLSKEKEELRVKAGPVTWLK